MKSAEHESVKGCVGAIDGTLIHAIIPIEKQVPYRGRKGVCMQQVMAACSFDMCFSFVMAGWEGTAHDQRILLETIYDQHAKFPHAPSGKYYVVEAGYTNMRGFLAPYRNVRYWLVDFHGATHVRNQKELFNYIHSSLRNNIDRSFGVLKNRFPILTKMLPYPFPIQMSIVVAAMAIHNFIRKEAIADKFFDHFEDEDMEVERDTIDEGLNTDFGEFSQVDESARNEMNNYRDAIANAMWVQNS